MKPISFPWLLAYNVCIIESHQISKRDFFWKGRPPNDNRFKHMYFIRYGLISTKWFTCTYILEVVPRIGTVFSMHRNILTGKVRHDYLHPPHRRTESHRKASSSLLKNLSCQRAIVMMIHL